MYYGHILENLLGQMCLNNKQCTIFMQKVKKKKKKKSKENSKRKVPYHIAKSKASNISSEWN